MAMDELKVQQETDGNQLKLTFVGSITVTASFPVIKPGQFTQVTLDLDKVTYINSAGVRRWMLWNWNIEKDFNSKTVFFVDRIPSLLVKQTAMIRGFFPRQAVPRTVYASYYCSACDGIKDCLFDINKDFGDRSLETISKVLKTEVECSKCKKPMDLDSIPEHYTSLLNTKSVAS